MGTNLIIPHIVGNSGVLRNFSAYFVQLIDVQDKTDLQVSAAFVCEYLYPYSHACMNPSWLLVMCRHASCIIERAACVLQVHTAGGLDLDFLAFGLSLALTVLLIFGTHETSLFNLGGTASDPQILLLAMCIKISYHAAYPDMQTP